VGVRLRRVRARRRRFAKAEQAHGLEAVVGEKEAPVEAERLEASPQARRENHGDPPAAAEEPLPGHEQRVHAGRGDVVGPAQVDEQPRRAGIERPRNLVRERGDGALVDLARRVDDRNEDTARNECVGRRATS